MTTRSKAADAKPAAESTVVADAIDFGPLTLAQRLQRARELLGGGIEKGGHNKAQDYAYVKAGDVSRLVYDALARVGVYAIPSYEEVSAEPLTTWISRGGAPQFMARLKVTLRVGRVEDKVGFTISTPQTPETITVETVGFGADSGDKGPYKAMTGGLKYALLHLLGLATDDDPEATSEATAPAAAPSEPRRVGPRSAPASGEAAAPTTPVGDDPNAKITTAQNRLIFGRANDAGLKPEEFKSLVFAVTGKRSSSQLVSKEVDEILAALADKDQITRAKQDTSFDDTVGTAPDPTSDKTKADAKELLDAAVAASGGTEVAVEADDIEAPTPEQIEAARALLAKV